MARKKGWYWPWILGGLMAVVLGANLILIYVATSDRSFAVEQDYYRKGLRWDAKREQDRRNAELGWTLDLVVASTLSPDGTVAITALLCDGDGGEITGAQIKLDAFHNARAAYILSADLKHAENGSYAASLPMRRPGLWEFRFEISRDGERFTHTTTKELFWR